MNSISNRHTYWHKANSRPKITCCPLKVHTSHVYGKLQLCRCFIFFGIVLFWLSIALSSSLHENYFFFSQLLIEHHCLLDKSLIISEIKPNFYEFRLLTHFLNNLPHFSLDLSQHLLIRFPLNIWLKFIHFCFLNWLRKISNFFSWFACMLHSSFPMIHRLHRISFHKSYLALFFELGWLDIANFFLNLIHSLLAKLYYSLFVSLG